jgi:hypothetical protein
MSVKKGTLLSAALTQGTNPKIFMSVKVSKNVSAASQTALS